MIHRAEFLHPGIVFSEESYADLPERSAKAAMADAPENAFAFTMYDLEEPDAELVERLGPGQKVVAVPQNKSVVHYLQPCEVIYVDDPRLSGDEHRTLRANMGNEGWNPVVKCRTGNYQPLLDGVVCDP